MKGPTTERATLESADAIASEPVSVGALVHKVLNATAAIKYGVSTVRTAGALGDLHWAELARIEEAAAMVARAVKTFASAAEHLPVIQDEQPADLYEVCCELAARLRVTEGRPVYCRAYGDCRGPWERRELVACASALLDAAVGCLPPDGMMNIAVTGLGRHVRLDVLGLRDLSLEQKNEVFERASGLGGRLGALMTVRATRAAGMTLSLRLPR